MASSTADYIVPVPSGGQIRVPREALRWFVPPKSAGAARLLSLHTPTRRGLHLVRVATRGHQLTPYSACSPAMLEDLATFEAYTLLDISHDCKLGGYHVGWANFAWTGAYAAALVRLCQRGPVWPKFGLDNPCWENEAGLRAIACSYVGSQVVLEDALATAVCWGLLERRAEEGAAAVAPEENAAAVGPAVPMDADISADEAAPLAPGGPR